jgi:hypothetical protein
MARMAGVAWTSGSGYDAAPLMHQVVSRHQQSVACLAVTQRVDFGLFSTLILVASRATT